MPLGSRSAKRFGAGDMQVLDREGTGVPIEILFCFSRAELCRRTLYSRNEILQNTRMAFPPRPLRLKSSFVWKFRLGGFALILGGLAAAGGFAWWLSGSARAIVEESSIWAAGVPASGG